MSALRRPVRSAVAAWRRRRLPRAPLALVAILLFASVNIGAGEIEDRSAPEGEQAETDRLTEARSLVREGSYAEAATLLEQVSKDAPEDAGVLRLYGEVLVATGRLQDAVPVLRGAVAQDSSLPRLHFQLASALAGTGEAEAALDEFAKEIEINEDQEIRFMACLNRSILLRKLHRPGEAVEELKAALELKPGHAEGYGDLAALHLELGNADEAGRVLERGESYGFRSARLQFNVGARLYNDKNYGDAEKAFRKALEADPEMAEAEKSLGVCLSRTGREEEALEHLRRYLELRPDAPDAAEMRERLGAGTAR